MTVIVPANPALRLILIDTIAFSPGFAMIVVESNPSEKSGVGLILLVAVAAMTSVAWCNIRALD